ncbi:sensor histidine kinase [Hymenobacter jeollabukensis]|uniref:sensor histidine kinase n=1 Tax=Hymenobacter jeollabukensis TaxID=2025313 RepID=UPI001485ADD7|nr:ATP-binding protein [Hymenobacter jeollabukensis]
MLIRNKLILRFTLLVLLIQLCFSLFVYYFHAATREQRFHARLAGKVDLTGRILIQRANLRSGILRTVRRRDLLTMPREQISIYSPHGRLLYASDDHIDQRGNLAHLSSISGPQPVSFRYAGREVIGAEYHYAGYPSRIFVAARDDEGFQQLDKLRLILLAGNLGALALIVVAGWFFAADTLRPMARIVRQVRRITASNLSQRLSEGNQKDEIAQLAMTFNRMLAGLEQAFESQKSFVSHASHELRTPLANALGTLETSVLYDQDLAEAKRSMQSAQEEIRRLIGLTNSLLALARADETTLSRQLVRLDDCLTQALDHCAAKYPGRSVRLSFGQVPEELDEPFQVRGNAPLLTTALLNLLDNACKYSQAPVQVELSYAGARTLQVTVQDAGVGIEPAALPRIFEPLFRAEGGRATASGFGLGLPMTRKIIRLHGGELTVESQVGEGTTATIQLPAAPVL